MSEEETLNYFKETIELLKPYICKIDYHGTGSGIIRYGIHPYSIDLYIDIDVLKNNYDIIKNIMTNVKHFYLCGGNINNYKFPEKNELKEIDKTLYIELNLDEDSIY